jgi:hypothetical protein
MPICFAPPFFLSLPLYLDAIVLDATQVQHDSLGPLIGHIVLHVNPFNVWSFALFFIVLAPMC